MAVVGKKTWAAHVTMRPAYPSDGDALARLGVVLGYEIDGPEAARRLQSLPATDSVFVARTATGLIGFVHLSVVRGLFEPPYVEIDALAVLRAWQGLGIGRRLAQLAESWVRDERLARLDVAPRYLTNEARAFFLHLGYVEAEIGQVLTKDIE